MSDWRPIVVETPGGGIYTGCSVCGERLSVDITHSCAGGAPASNLPERGGITIHSESLEASKFWECKCGYANFCTRKRCLKCKSPQPEPEPLVSLSEMNRRIAEAVKAERKMCAEILQEASIKLIGGKSRVNQVDRHVAWVLTSHAEKIRERGK